MSTSRSVIDSKKIAMTKICSVQFCYSFFWSLSIGSLFAIWLDKALGLSNEQIGVLIGFNSGVSIFFKPFIGYFLDKLGLRKHILYIISFSAIFLAPFFIYVYGPLLRNDSTFIYGVIIGAIYLGFLFQAGSGAVQNYCDRFARTHESNFGVVNSFNNLAWGTSALISGVLYNINPSLNFVLCSVMGLGMFISVMLLKTKGFDNADTDIIPKEKLKKQDVMQLLANKNFWAFCIYILLVCTILWSAFNQVSRYFITFFDSQATGIIWNSRLDAIGCALAFTLGFYIYDLIKKVGESKSIILCAAVIAINLGLLGFAGVHHIFAMMVVGKILIVILNPLFAVILLAYIAYKFDVKVNALTFMIGCQFVANVALTFINPWEGYLFQKFGFPISFEMLALIAAGGAVFALLTMRASKKDNTLIPQTE